MAIMCFCNAYQICRPCWETVVDGPRRAGAKDAAKLYAAMGRNQRLVYQGEHYARPMPSFEYLVQITRESQEV